MPVVIKVNNRKVLYGMAEAAGIADRFIDMTVAIDKLDKVGIEGVRKELLAKGIAAEAVNRLDEMLASSSMEGLDVFLTTETGREGLAELNQVFGFLRNTPIKNQLQFDATLARGLSYYTGCIFEVTAVGVVMGSIGGGGRYADLTGVFGVPGLSGVGISFGADRIYDVMEQLKVFPEALKSSVEVLFASFDEVSQRYAFECATVLRNAGVATEVFPEAGKLKKQFEYSAKRNIPFVAIVGDTEMAQGVLTIKNQVSGDQSVLTVGEFIQMLRP